MVRMLSLSLLLGVLFLSLAPPARADSITVAVDEIVAIAPVPTNTGVPLVANVAFYTWGIDFTGTTQSGQSFDIGYTWGALQSVSTQYFGTPNAQVLAWDSSMSFVGCAWESDCAGTLNFGNGVTGSGQMWYSPHFAYVEINSLTYQTAEPSSLLLFASGLLGVAGFLRRRISLRV